MFPTIEGSRLLGTPVELYRFQYGELAESAFCYTNSTEGSIEFDGYVYEPIAISRDSVKSSGTLDKTTMPIRTQRDLPLREMFQAYPPSFVVMITIRQGHLNDPDGQFPVVWMGRLLGIEREGSELVLSGEPIAIAMKRAGLKRHYQFPCPHVLFGPRCKASRAAATATATVQSKAGATLTLLSGWLTTLGKPLNKYRQGELRWIKESGELEIRTILQTIEPNTLLLSGPTSSIPVGGSVSVSLGCNHETSAMGGAGDCTNLHNNGPNYGGCKWIPGKNPIGRLNNFY